MTWHVLKTFLMRHVLLFILLGCVFFPSFSSFRCNNLQARPGSSHPVCICSRKGPRTFLFRRKQWVCGLFAVMRSNSSKCSKGQRTVQKCTEWVRVFHCLMDAFGLYGISTACECLWCRAPDKPPARHGCWTATTSVCVDGTCWNYVSGCFFPILFLDVWDLGYFNCTVAVRQERALKKAAQVLFEDQRKSYNSETWHEELASRSCSRRI